MKSNFEQFFKQRMGLAITVLIFAVLTLCLVVPIIYSSLDAGSKNIYWGVFLFGLGIMTLVFFGRNSKVESIPKEKFVESSLVFLSYQQLINEVERCSNELEKYRKRAYCFLILGWLVLLIGRWLEYPPYNHPIYAFPIFALALLGATRSLEEENELDVRIVHCILKGAEMENKHQKIEPQYFHELVKKFEGWGMRLFTFIRVSPALMIIASVFQAGPVLLLANSFSLPWWSSSCLAGIILSFAYIFLARIAYRPYLWMLGKLKTVPT